MKLKRLFLAIMLLVSASSRAQVTVITFESDSVTPVAADDTADTDTQSVVIANDSSLPWAQRVRERIERLVDNDMFETSQLGMGVYDLAADSMIFQKGLRQTLRPASTEKLFTAITALQTLGGSYRFETSLYVDGEVTDSVLHGNVYIKGGMDPLFGHDDMRAFAAALAGMGIDSIGGEVMADVSFKDTLRWGKGWCWDDDMETLTPLMYNGKDNFMSEFFAALADQGIESSGIFSKTVVGDNGSLRCLVTRYHTIDQVLMPMLKESDNLCAEALFYQLGATDRTAYASASRSAEKIRALLNRMGLDASRYEIADGSGVSLYNYTSAEALIKTLAFAYSRSNIFNHLYPALPIAGYDGTLVHRLRRTAAQDNVHAKTGTLEGVYSLAGYATSPEGHKLAFAIINQGVMHSRNARRFQDRVCRAITEP